MDFILEQLLGESSLVTRVVLLFLLLMSVGSWYVIIYKLLALGRVRERAETDLRRFQDAKDLSMAMQAVTMGGASAVGRIAQTAVRELKRIERASMDNKAKAKVAKENVQRSLTQGVNSELVELSAMMPFLGTCANASPYLGLFGTVWGIMLAFHSISTQKTAAIAAVAPGMSEALITTVLGLAVAIPASVAYNVLSGQIGRVETSLYNFAAVFHNRIEREMPWIGASGDDD